MSRQDLPLRALVGLGNRLWRGGIVAIFGAGIIFAVMSSLAACLLEKPPQPDKMPSGIALLILAIRM